MAQELKAFIDKLQKEGVEAAEKKAKELEAGARKKADEIIARARSEAKKYLDQAHQKIEQEKNASEAALRQSARDITLALKNRILAMLGNVIAQDVRQALTPAELAALIKLAVAQYGAQADGSLVVSLKEEDRVRLQDGFLCKLQAELKKDILLKGSGEISAGFIISFDKGKSHFDFTDEALTGYLSGFLRPKLAELLKEEQVNGE